VKVLRIPLRCGRFPFLYTETSAAAQFPSNEFYTSDWDFLRFMAELFSSPLLTVCTIASSTLHPLVSSLSSPLPIFRNSFGPSSLSFPLLLLFVLYLSVSPQSCDSCRSFDIFFLPRAGSFEQVFLHFPFFFFSPSSFFPSPLLVPSQW